MHKSSKHSVLLAVGWSDQTAIWFAQHIAGETRLIDFHQDAQRPFSHYLQVLQNRGYHYATMWLPHDAQAKSLGTGRSIEEIARNAGWRVRIVPRLSVADGINAVRTLFPTIWFDRERCADGIQALRYYRYDVDPNTGQFSRNPMHDAASNGSDALRYGPQRTSFGWSICSPSAQGFGPFVDPADMQRSWIFSPWPGTGGISASAR